MPKFDFGFDPPLMNAAGILGFAPNPRYKRLWSRLGAFVTNPISFHPRLPVQGTRYISFGAGFLLHTGHPNPGIQAALRRYAPAWARSELPVIVHLLPQDPAEAAQMARRLEGLENVIGVELGLPLGIEKEAARSMMTAAMGELPVMARLPFNSAVELAPAAAEVGVSAVSLGPPRGILADEDGKLVEGRLYGSAVFPFAASVARQLVSFGIPVVAAGGVYREQDIRLFQEMGAMAVQLDAWLWLI